MLIKTANHAVNYPTHYELTGTLPWLGRKSQCARTAAQADWRRVRKPLRTVCRRHLVVRPADRHAGGLQPGGGQTHRRAEQAAIASYTAPGPITAVPARWRAQRR